MIEEFPVVMMAGCWDDLSVFFVCVNTVPA